MTRDSLSRTIRATQALWIFLAALVLLAAAHPAVPRACAGDCDLDGTVTVDELVRGVNIALGAGQLDACPAFDRDGSGSVTVDELVAAVSYALDGCRTTPEPSATSSPTSTPTEKLIPGPPTPTLPPGVLRLRDAVARNANGTALRLGQTVTTEGVVTVDAGAFANNKLKVFAQDTERGIMVFHANSAAVDALQTGDRVRVTGVIRQEDTTASDNPGIGTVMVDITSGSWSVLDSRNALPPPRGVTLSEIVTQGVPYVGSLAHVSGVRKQSGNWPALGSRSTQVTIAEDSGASIILRFQRNTITPALVDELNAIGDGAFDLVGIVVQDDTDGSPDLLQGFEIWTRGADDIDPAGPQGM